MGVSVLAFVASLIVALGLYGLPAAPYLDDDVCITSMPRSVKEGSSGSDRGSWWPLGVECRWRVPGRSKPVIYFRGPPEEFAWLALGVAGIGCLGLLGGLGVGIRDLLRSDDFPAL